MGLFLCIISLLFMSNSFISCGPNQLLCRTRRFKGIPAAVSYMHASLPIDRPLEDKCKRYAVLLAGLSRAAVPYQSDAFKASTMDHDQLEKEFRKIPKTKVAEAYMSAIEGYRVRKLEPPFLELIQCLELVEIPEAMTYLEDEELSLIVKIYKQTLESPDTKINLDLMNLRLFRASFRANLEYLFSDNLDPTCKRINNLLHTNSTSDAEPFDIMGTSTPDLQAQLKNLHKQQSRERYQYRCRERARLTQLRLRIMKPEMMREKGRARQRQRRERYKKLQNQQYGPSGQQAQQQVSPVPAYEPPVAPLKSAVLPIPRLLHVTEPTHAPLPAPEAAHELEEPKTNLEWRKQRQQLRRQKLFPVRWQRFLAQLQPEQQKQEETLRFLREHNWIQQRQQQQRDQQHLPQQPQPEPLQSQLQLQQAQQQYLDQNMSDPVLQFLSSDYFDAQQIQSPHMFDPSTSMPVPQSAPPTSMPPQIYNSTTYGEGQLQFGDFMNTFVPESQSEDFDLLNDLLKSPSYANEADLMERLMSDLPESEISKTNPPGSTGDQAR